MLNVTASLSASVATSVTTAVVLVGTSRVADVTNTGAWFGGGGSVTSVTSMVTAMVSSVVASGTPSWTDTVTL